MHGIIVMGAVAGVTACMTVEEPRWVYQTKLSKEQSERAQKECDYEAEKATASDTTGTAFLTWRRLYIKCLDLKGVSVIEISRAYPSGIKLQ